MIGLSIHLDGDGVWPDMKDAPEAMLEGVSRLTKGMTSGQSSVGLRIRMPDGTLVFAQTSMFLFQAAALAFKTADERDAQIS